MLPQALTILDRSANEIVYGPAPTGLGITDTLAGAVPLLHFADGRLQVSYLEIPPPLPLTFDSLSSMWHEVVDAAVPLPGGVAAQGRLLPGVTLTGSHLLPDVLDRAHAAARGLLARWPRNETTTNIWRGIELAGGREDLVATARAARNVPGFFDSSGRQLPTRTMRRTRSDEPWTSRRLRHVAQRLAAVVAAAMVAGPDEAGNALLKPFHAVAAQALPNSLGVDMPLSAWPPAARETYTAMIAALAVVEPAASAAASVRAPLCFLWRLYESWTAVRCLTVLDALPSFTRIFGPAVAVGCEWAAQWDAGDGTTVFALAQARISGEPRSFGGVLPIAVRSISSDLRPDVLLCVVTSDGRVGMAAVDAKRLSGGAMDASMAAEAASKYVWGLRLEGDVNRSASAQVSAVVLATTALPPTMHSSDSRIFPVPLVPDEPMDEFARAISATLESCLADASA